MVKGARQREWPRHLSTHTHTLDLTHHNVCFRDPIRYTCQPCIPNTHMHAGPYTYTLYLYPRHLCRGVYSFCFSVRMFVCSFVRLFVRSFVCSFVRTSFRRVEFASKFCVKVSQVMYISATTHQKAFIFGP